MSKRIRKMGNVIVFLLPSVKMKSRSPRQEIFAQELHDFLFEQFHGYTVASGNITGYWRTERDEEECNEHRQYQVAYRRSSDRERLERYLARLALELQERVVYCQCDGKAYLIQAK